MSVRTVEEIMNLVRERVGSNTDDASIAFIEDISDTLNNYESSNNEDWHRKYTENDEQWRKRYTDRFYSGGNPDKPEPDEPPKPNSTPTPDEPPKMKTYADLFKQEVK